VVTPVTYTAPVSRYPAQPGGSKEDVWMLNTDKQGYVTECARANFMFVREGRIKLPNRSKVLPGISMDTILELAELLGIAIDEGLQSTHDVYLADEALVSGTRYCLQPVATVNGVSLGREIPGPVTGRLIKAWSEKVGLDFVHQALDHLPTEGH
jgi:branched-subunit amino acid aminotransferase/4-amino-4-deoxychorismate lyase